MSKEEEVKEVAEKLILRGMKKELALKNLLECDMYFIDALNEILK